MSSSPHATLGGGHDPRVDDRHPAAVLYWLWDEWLCSSAKAWLLLGSPFPRMSISTWPLWDQSGPWPQHVPLCSMSSPARALQKTLPKGIPPHCILALKICLSFCQVLPTQGRSLPRAEPQQQTWRPSQEGR